MEWWISGDWDIFIDLLCEKYRKYEGFYTKDDLKVIPGLKEFFGFGVEEHKYEELSNQ